jgi:arylsulfatase A-like enzyme
MTGRHPGHGYIRDNRQAKAWGLPFEEGQTPVPAGELTLPLTLKRLGYTLGGFGKWGLGPVGSTGDPNRQGFDLFYCYNCQAAAHSYYPPHLWRNSEKVVINSKPVPGHARQPEGEVRASDWQAERYAPDLMHAEALRWIREHRAQPFFLYLAGIEPHVSLHPPTRLVDSYPREWDTKPYRGQNGYLPHPRPRAAYAALITSLDEQVGAVLATLKELGLEDDTLVVFTSDNGSTHGGRDPEFGIGGVDTAFFNSVAGLRGLKGSVYEGGLRVPLLVRWPGRVAAGSTSDLPGYFPDWFPTLCAAAGVKAPAGLDGVDLLPMLTGQGAQAPRKPLVWVFPEYGGQVAVRLDAWKAVRRDLARRSPGPWEVYNLRDDPREERDVAAQHPEVIARAVVVLRAQMDENEVFPLKVPGVNG